MKVFVIGKSANKDSLQNSEVQNISIIAERQGNQLVAHYECYPDRKIKFTFQELNGRVCLEFQLAADEFLAIGDKPDDDS